MSERRRRERVAIPGGSAAIPAEFKTQRASGVGKIVRLGDSGLVIRTADPLDVSESVELVLYDPTDSKIEISGTARRSADSEGKREVFIELDASSEAYDELFERLLIESPGGIDSPS